MSEGDKRAGEKTGGLAAACIGKSNARSKRARAHAQVRLEQHPLPKPKLAAKTPGESTSDRPSEILMRLALLKTSQPTAAPSGWCN